MSEGQERLEHLLDDFYDGGSPPSHQEICCLIDVSYLLGRLSVYNENGWDVDDAK